MNMSGFILLHRLTQAEWGTYFILKLRHMWVCNNSLSSGRKQCVRKPMQFWTYFVVKHWTYQQVLAAFWMLSSPSESVQCGVKQNSFLWEALVFWTVKLEKNCMGICRLWLLSVKKLNFQKLGNSKHVYFTQL